ncbi:DNA-processing protein DprA [uncultured Demequina sp.]|uniref:DNA-processing protein DprA n=1 Tax=uncultured Demequina sp. TaxID=693499 RepID=UPI0025D35F7F|nr:DNA-processing protein DprA [uncultured Demequina sp.]
MSARTAEPADVDARMSWSAVAEPADAVAGWLVQTLGAAGAWEWLRGAISDPVAATMRLVERAAPADVDAAVASVARWAPRVDGAEPADLRRRAAACGARVVVPGDGDWPTSVDDLGLVAPHALWVRGGGDPKALGAEGVAIVGARASTSYGDHVAAAIAADVVGAGRTVVSGGAFGIDVTAHRAALAADGRTIAVMAGGVDRLYPAGNAHILERVLERGVVVSEVPPGWAPHRSRFLTRNRLIACAGVTVVVEAAWRSGALSTATHAQRLLRPVAAVPGPVTSASSAGCHRLVRDGQAVLVTNGQEVLELVEPLDPSRADSGDGDPGRLEFDRPEDRAVFDALGRRTVERSELVAAAGVDAAAVRAALGRLELAGLVEARGLGWRRVRGVPLT